MKADSERNSIYEPFTYRQRISLQLTMRCPLKCSHCGVNSGPERREEMSTEQVVKLLDEIGRCGAVRVVSFTGGEPFLNLERLRAMLNCAELYQLKIAIITSSSWATTYERALDVLASLPPIANLSLSADKYHLEFVPLSNVRNAARAAIELDIEVGAFICLENDGDGFLDDFRQAMGDELLTKINVLTRYVGLMGRAAQSVGISRKVEWAPFQDLPNARCSAVSMPVVMPDGRVMACCGGTVSDPQNWKALTLGNLNSESIGEILDRADHNHLVHALRLFGPRELARVATEELRIATFNRLYERNNICDICRDVCADPDIAARLKDYLEEPAFSGEIALGRLLEFGEPALCEVGGHAHADSDKSIIRG